MSTEDAKELERIIRKDSPVSADVIAALIAHQDNWVDRCNTLQDALQAVTAERDAFKADAERLDWFDKQGCSYGFEDMHEGNKWEINGPYRSLRVAIDAEIKGTS